VLAREKARIILEKYCLMTNYHRKKIGNDNKWTYVLVPMATLYILFNECTADTDLCTSKAMSDCILEMQTDIMAMFKKEVNAIKELQDTNIEVKDRLNESVITLKRDIKAGLNKTTKVSNAIVLQLGTIEAMLTDEYDEATFSDEGEKSMLPEKYRTILLTKKESAPFLVYLALSIKTYIFYWVGMMDMMKQHFLMRMKNPSFQRSTGQY
jgi:hypothetical protein